MENRLSMPNLPGLFLLGGHKYHHKYFSTSCSEEVRFTLKQKKITRQQKAFFLFIAPAVILFSTFFIIPLFLSVGFSFTNYDGWKTMEFVGLKNYITLFKDKDFYSSLWRTLIYTGFSLPFKVIIPLVLAVLLTNKTAGLKGLSRTLIYIPVLLSPLVVGLTINWFFSQEYGVINYCIMVLGGQPLDWALNPKLAMFVVSFASNWASTGFFLIIFIGGINNISEELLEAANIDGANANQRFFRVVLPSLSPTTFLVVLLSTINLLKEFALVQGITLGGPGSSTTFIIQYIINKGFNQFEYGYASAISVIAIIIFGSITFVQFKISEGDPR